jgi:hypothetical protein
VLTHSADNCGVGLVAGSLSSGLSHCRGHSVTVPSARERHKNEKPPAS